MKLHEIATTMREPQEKRVARGPGSGNSDRRARDQGQSSRRRALTVEAPDASVSPPAQSRFTKPNANPLRCALGQIHSYRRADRRPAD